MSQTYGPAFVLLTPLNPVPAATLPRPLPDLSFCFCMTPFTDWGALARACVQAAMHDHAG